MIPVGRPFYKMSGSGNDFVQGRLDPLGRGKFLERGLGMLRRPPLHCKVRLPKLEDEAFGSFEPPIEKNRP